MYNPDNRKIIVSMTSWPKRIEQAYNTIESIFNGTILPDYFVLNLSLDEFPNREKDLPNSLILLAQNNKSFILNFVEGNTRTFKKIIPTIQLFMDKGNYYIITVDDDKLYSSNFIDIMVSTISSLPSDCGSFCPSIVNIQGWFTIYKSEIFKQDLWNKLTDEVIQYGVDDEYYDYYLNEHHVKMYHFNGGVPVSHIGLYIQCKEPFPLHDEYLSGNRLMNAKESIRKIKF